MSNQPTTPSPAATTADSARPSVLVIDDSPDVHRLLRARLRTEDLEIVSAASGPEGLATAKAKAPSIILLDLDMPGTDGFEVLRQLKEDKTVIDIPVIILSGLQSSQDKVTAFDLGAVDYITKPFDLTELRVRVRSALRVQQLVQMLAQKAQIDGLTGLWNRAHFDRRWAEEVSRVERHGRPLSVAVIDIDHFKSVNDTFGHPAGDAVIQGLSRILQRECRASDVACRYGGEEFALIMPDTAPQDSSSLCERVRRALEETSWSRHPERRITASFGVAGSTGNGVVAAQAWLEAADKNLYASKKAGRNRVTIADIGPATLVRAAG